MRLMARNTIFGITLLAIASFGVWVRPDMAPALAAQSTTTKTISVDMQDIKFVPDTLFIPANTEVEVTLTNSGALPHDFSIDKLNIHETVDPGKSVEFTINAPAGTYQYYCNEPGHKAAGMVGTLTVSASANGASTPSAQSPRPVTPAPGTSNLSASVEALQTTVNQQATAIAQLTTRVSALEAANGSSSAQAAQATAGSPNQQSVSGTGTMVSDKFHLEPGRYKVSASVDATNNVSGFFAHLDGPNSFDESLFSEVIQSSGTWTASTIVTVDSEGDYFVQVSGTSATWTLTFAPF